MGFKMKGSPMQRNFGIGKTPLKQLAPEYMRTPEEEAFYKSDGNLAKYESVPMGEYRTPSATSRYTGPDEKFDWDKNTNPKKKGDVVSLGIPSSNEKYMGPTLSKEEVDKRRANLPERPEFGDENYEEKDDKRSRAYKKLKSGEQGTKIKTKKKK